MVVGEADREGKKQGRRWEKSALGCLQRKIPLLPPCLAAAAAAGEDLSIGSRQPGAKKDEEEVQEAKQPSHSLA